MHRRPIRAFPTDDTPRVMAATLPAAHDAAGGGDPGAVERLAMGALEIVIAASALYAIWFLVAV